MNIEPGTACFLIKVSAGILGRVVEVESSATSRFDWPGLWHEVTAPWLREEYPESSCFAQPERLLPLDGTGIAPPGKHKRIVEESLR